ncbi:MAG: NTP transferase domain-containing protein, partial [Leptospiraceae bacterium]|nr:NTP transferase domain-containing protein [Leptospiraceae bacterium]
MDKVLGAIPARYDSTRFPGKPLARIGDKPMIQWVYEAARRCRVLDHIVVATDDERIRDAVTAFGGDVILTGDHHQSGTDRLSEVADFYAEH